MRAITHFFCEDIRRIDFTRDMFDRQKLRLDPFSNRVLPKFDMPSSFRGHVVRPSDTGVVVIEEESGRNNVGKSVPRCHHALAHVSEIYHLFRSCICGANFGFTRTQRSTFLPFRQPTDRATIAEDDTTTHASKFEERKKCAVGDSITNLRPPTRIAVRRKRGR